MAKSNASTAVQNHFFAFELVFFAGLHDHVCRIGTLIDQHEPVVAPFIIIIADMGS